MYTRTFAFIIVFFSKIAFILIELHLFEAYSIGNYTISDQTTWDFGSESEGVLEKKSCRGYAFIKKGTSFKKGGAGKINVTL